MSNSNQTTPLGSTEAFQEAITSARRRHPELVMMLGPGTHACFAISWKDERGTCDQAANCAASVRCHEAWREAQILQREVLHRPRIAEAAPAEEPVHALPEKVAARPKRMGKPKPHTHQRLSYAPMQRPVDEAVAHFIRAIGDPAVLPEGWQPTELVDDHERFGRCMLSRTQSYTSVLIDGSMVCRFWTNASSKACVDVADELVRPLTKIVGRVGELPDGVKKKSRPCTHRVDIKFRDATSRDTVAKLADAVVRTYHLAPPTE